MVTTVLIIKTKKKTGEILQSNITTLKQSQQLEEKAYHNYLAYTRWNHRHKWSGYFIAPCNFYTNDTCKGLLIGKEFKDNMCWVSFQQGIHF